MSDLPLEDDDEGANDPLAVEPGSELAESEPRYSLTVGPGAAGQRLDAFLASAVPGVSRARIRRSIDAGLTTVDGQSAKASHRIAVGEEIELVAAPAAAGPMPENIPLSIVYEDDAIVVVNKPPGMVVHPAKGHWSGTLAAALVHRFGALSAAGGATRPGIVHRLDRDTSGVIVVARTDAAHASLAQQFHDRTVEKEYLAIVAGVPDWDAERVDAAICPHPTHREKMALRDDHPESRPAVTHFETIERFRGFALLRARPKTGRTHQIRLHAAHRGLSILCDKLYGSRSRITAGEVRGITRSRGALPELPDDRIMLDRQALHAHRLTIQHPTSGEQMLFEASLPEDMNELLLLLRAAKSAS